MQDGRISGTRSKMQDARCTMQDARWHDSRCTMHACCTMAGRLCAHKSNTHVCRFTQRQPCRCNCRDNSRLTALAPSMGIGPPASASVLSASLPGQAFRRIKGLLPLSAPQCFSRAAGATHRSPHTPLHAPTCTPLRARPFLHPDRVHIPRNQRL